MMHQLNDCLKDLEYSTSELLENVERSGSLMKSDIKYKIKSGLEAMWQFILSNDIIIFYLWGDSQCM